MLNNYKSGPSVNNLEQSFNLRDLNLSSFHFSLFDLFLGESAVSRNLGLSGGLLPSIGYFTCAHFLGVNHPRCQSLIFVDLIHANFDFESHFILRVTPNVFSNNKIARARSAFH